MHSEFTEVKDFDPTLMIYISSNIYADFKDFVLSHAECGWLVSRFNYTVLALISFVEETNAGCWQASSLLPPCRRCSAAVGSRLDYSVWTCI